MKRRLEIKILKVLQKVTSPANLVILWYNCTPLPLQGAQRSNNLIFLLTKRITFNHVLESRIYRVFFAIRRARKIVTKTPPLQQGVTVTRGEGVMASGKCVYVNRLVLVGSSERGELPFKRNRTQRWNFRDSIKFASRKLVYI